MNRDWIHKSQALAGRVRRYHTWPTLHTQTVAEHCWRVATIFYEVFKYADGQLMYYILHHDSGEQLAGDTPFNAKGLVPGFHEAINAAEAIGRDRLEVELPSITELEFVQFKCCDLLEMWEFGQIELLMGNQLARPVVESCVKAINELCNKHNLEEPGQWMYLWAT